MVVSWQCIADEICKHGTMTVLVRDRERAQIGVKVLDLLHTYIIYSRQAEPHNKDQKFVELGWQDTKVWPRRRVLRRGRV